MSEKLNEVVAGIGVVLATIPGLKVYDHEPRDIDALPGASIDGPIELLRVDPEGAEPQLGAGAAGYTTGWTVTFMVRLYEAFDDPQTGMTAIRRLLAQAVIAVDSDRNLGTTALDAVLSRATFGLTPEDRARQMAFYECELRALLLV